VRPEGLVIDGGHTLQPLLYALALEQLFPDAQVIGGRLYYCTAAGGFEERGVTLDERSRAAAGRATRAVDEALEAGFLPAAPEAGACERCDYQIVCGPYEEMRVARKDPDALQALHDLRREP
jgi:CRISPR/Cas system-associated exonuclease Cas4 (RecB family)